MKTAHNLVISSDFKDYYDTEASSVYNENSVVYSRFLSKVPGKVEELKFLNYLGNKTIPIMPVSKISMDVERVVVYMDLHGHRGKGKLLMRLNEANMLYPNKLASEYFDTNPGITFKILYIGKRRFRCVLRNSDFFTENEILDISELPSGYNLKIALPIFSIDYVQDRSNQMLACDFNSVQRLDYLGMEKLLSANDVISEIYRAMLEHKI